MFYDLAVAQPIKMLENFSRIIDKAVAYADHKKFDPEVLLHARLAPDQYSFIRQAQIICDGAKLSAARLTGK